MEQVRDWPLFARRFRQAAPPFKANLVGAVALEAAAAYQRSELQEVFDSDTVRNELLDTAWDKFTRADRATPPVLAWILAASSLLQGTGAEAPYLPLRGRVRFPILDRLEDVGHAQPDAHEIALSRALILSREVYRDSTNGEFSLNGIAYRRSQLLGAGAPGARKPDSYLSDAIAAIGRVATRPGASEFAVLHHGFLLQLRKSQEGDRLLGIVAGKTQDPWIRYMANLLLGRSAIENSRPGAERFLREALQLFPGAPAATRLLAGLRYSQGDQQEATRLLDSQDSAIADPWLTFHFGEYVLWPGRLARVRAWAW